MSRLFLLIFIFTLSLPLWGQNSESNEDDFRITLLSCSPGDEIYSLFGHTAIRVQNSQTDLDLVYNYGIFDFNTDNFIWRFALGHTDYQLGRLPYEHFVFEYRVTNRTIWEQELFLTKEEKVNLINLLEENYLPSQRVYRYNFLYDNCATRPLEKIKEATSRELNFSDNKDYQNTFRDILHRYSENHLWCRFGMDLCLGSKADRLITTREESFAPIELIDYISSAHFNNNTSLVGEKRVILSSTPEANKGTPLLLSPLAVFAALFIFMAILSVYQVNRRVFFNLFDLPLFGIYGLAGCILLFLVLFSEHPAMSPNYLLLVLNPLHLLFAILLCFKGIKRIKFGYHCLNFIVLTLFICFSWVIPQKFDLAILPLAGSLWIRSLSFSYITIKSYKLNK